MKFIKEFKLAGEPSKSIPLYLCEQARNSLSIWKYKSLDEMQARLKDEIESINRCEFRCEDDNGNVKAMMIFEVWEDEPHTGHDVLMIKFAFSTDKGLLTKGYRFMKDVAKSLKIKFLLISRQTGPLEITHKFIEIK